MYSSVTGSSFRSQTGISFLFTVSELKTDFLFTGVFDGIVYSGSSGDPVLLYGDRPGLGFFQRGRKKRAV